jgi:thymidylate synthase (FAD)
MTEQIQILEDPNYRSYLDHGFVGLVDVMGSDHDIARAARTSYGKGTKSVSDDRNLIRYLIRHQHTSPIEMAEVKFHLKVPIFVMRQLVRHRTASLNEHSGRYSEMTDEMYVPERERIQRQSVSNKQGSGDQLDESEQNFVLDIVRNEFESAFIAYRNLVETGLAKELARIVLPVANYTELYWKIDLKNFFHMIKLRTDPHAQKEIQDMANLMYDLVKPKFPIACQAFEDYWRNAVTFSQMEMELIKEYLDYFKNDLRMTVQEATNLSQREKEEFLKKISL